MTNVLQDKFIIGHRAGRANRREIALYARAEGAKVVVKTIRLRRRRLGQPVRAPDRECRENENSAHRDREFRDGRGRLIPA